MYLFTVFALLTLKVVNSHGSVEKCCASDEYINVSNGTYQCVQDTSRRLGIIANSFNFIKNHSEGECVDITARNFFKFQFSDGKILQKTLTGEQFFPKCCPLGDRYNSKLHACHPDLNTDESFIDVDFVRVGLPHCKLIVDQKHVAPVNLSEDFCIDNDENNDLVRRECRKNLEDCDSIRCVKKCCPDGQSFVNGANCLNTYVHGLNLSFSRNIDEPEEPFAVISNRTCKRIYLMSEQRYIFKLDSQGTFKYWQNVSNGFVYEPVEHPHSYCIEHSNRDNAEGFFFFMCFPETPVKEKFEYTLVPKILSCVFLILTIVIYLVLNETRNIFGKILLNYCLGTLALFALLVYAQVDLKPSDASCKLTGYALIFFSTVSFAWLNVMCCDIWFTFGCTKQSVGAHQRRKDLKRLICYMLYGYGMPIALTLLIFLFSSSTVLPNSVHPYVGMVTCFIERRTGNYGAALFLRLPHLIIQMVNTVLFFKTIIYCLKIKNEINRINDTTRSEKRTRFKKDKERLSLILKLSIIMGVTYIFDTISSFSDMSEMGDIPKYIEIIWDFINCLQGVFIFIIFICKRKIFNNILRKMRIPVKGRPHTMQSTISSTTRMSMLNHNSAPKNGSINIKSK